MSKIKIFVEGKNDKNFIFHLCKLLEINIEDRDVISTGGYKNLHLNMTHFEEAINFKQKSIVIFDADLKGIDNGGFLKRKKLLEDKKAELKIDFELFLFPNNKDDGYYENLLENIINEKHQCKLDCFNLYEKCLKKYKDCMNNFLYDIPPIKAKMYSYMSTFKMSRNQFEKFKNDNNWFFDNTDYWNFNSYYLIPLKNFLLKNNK